MRRLGAALRVEAMSLYKHVPAKAALVDLVVERVLTELTPPADTAPWDERLRHVANELRCLARDHPHVFPLLARRVPAAPAAFAPIDAALGALQAAGLDDDAVVQHFWAFVAYVTGALLAETAAQTGVGASSIRIPETLDRAALPHLGRFGTALGACDFATEYARGLEILIAAVRGAGRGGVG